MSRSAWDEIQRNVVLVGDARERLAELPDRSVDCVVTSPPYFNLRDYGTPGQIGLEANVDEWVDELRLVMRGIARVLKPSGSVWLNLGDTYSRHDRHGAPPKSLVLGPERLALHLIADGWTIRNKTVWAKTNSMPSPVKDRLACGWEVVYLLVRSRRYFFDLDAIRASHRSRGQARRPAKATQRPPNRPAWAGPLAGNNSGLARMKARGLVGHPLGKNPGDVWSVAPSNFRGSHHATFPPDLVELPLLSTCPERLCAECGVPWWRRVAATGGGSRGELRPSCGCDAGSRPGLVLDPFFGAGTVGLVAERLERDWIGIELNPDFAAVAEERISAARTTETKAA